MERPKFNGTARVVVWVMSVVAGTASGALGAGVYVGSISQSIKEHVQTQGIHESNTVKTARIEAHVAPLRREIDVMQGRLSRIDEKTDRILEILGDKR